jgi:hypothetical protein
MKRRQLFEFEDLNYWPQLLRNYITEVLSTLLVTADVYAPMVPQLAAVLQRTGTRRVVDLCSGSCGVSLAMKAALERELAEPLELVLSDKYPNIARFEAASAAHERCSFVSKSVDALEAHPELEGLRTMFTALHHFEPAQVEQILQRAVDDRAPIAILEFTERDPKQIAITTVASPITCLVLTPKIRPLTLGRLLFTYVLPIVPLTYCWDSAVSALRTYLPEELQAIVARLAGSESYEWDIGQTERRRKGLPVRVTYLIGVPI